MNQALLVQPYNWAALDSSAPEVKTLLPQYGRPIATLLVQELGILKAMAGYPPCGPPTFLQLDAEMT